MGVRTALIKWFASEQSHFTQIGKEESDFGYVPLTSSLREAN